MAKQEKSAKAQEVESEVLEPTIEEVSNALTVEEVIKDQIQKFNIVDAFIAELKTKFKNLKIKGVEDKKGYKAVKEARSIVRKYRTSVNKKREELKAESLAIGRGIDAEAKRITALLLEVEEPLIGKIEAIDKEIEEAKLKAEKEAEEQLNNRVNLLKESGLQFDGAFYSIGSQISVDLVTIKDFGDEDFEAFKSRVQAVNDKLIKEREIEQLNNERRKQLIDLWSFLPEDQKLIDFGVISNEEFETIKADANKAKQAFEDQKRQQAEEAERQKRERLELNYERRSFKLEKEGFLIAQNGDVYFANELTRITIERAQLENYPEEDFQALFDEAVKNKKKNEEDFEKLAEQRKKNAEAKAKKDQEEARFKSRIDALSKIGLKFDGVSAYVFHDINFAVLDLQTYSDEEFNDALIGATKRRSEIEKELQAKAEAEAEAKLTERAKIEKYIDQIFEIQTPTIENEKINELFGIFKDQLNNASNKLLTQLTSL